MIAVDTSALMALVLDEPAAEACSRAMEVDEHLLISAATLAEALVVASGRGRLAKMRLLIDGLDFEVVPADAATANRVASIYARWGKGVHPAKLNFCDCFAYDLARQRDVKLLFIGQDFAQTDVASAL